MKRFPVVAAAISLSGCTINAQMPDDFAERAVDRYMENIRREQAQRVAQEEGEPNAWDAVVKAWTSAKGRACALVHEISDVDWCAKE